MQQEMRGRALPKTMKQKLEQAGVEEPGRSSLRGARKTLRSADETTLQPERSGDPPRDREELEEVPPS